MREATLKWLVLFFMVVLVNRVRCQYPEPFLECYLEGGLLKFDIGVFRNSVPFSSVHFVDQNRVHLTNGECPDFSGNPDPTLNEGFFRTIFYVDPATDLITDGRACGIEVIETGKEYQFRVETNIEFERDRKGDIQFIYNCHADFAATDVVSTMLEIRDPDLVQLYPPVEALLLRAVTGNGGALLTATLGDGSVISTIDIGEYFALQLEFETTANSSAMGATCDKLYVSVDDTYVTRTEDIINPTTHCPANSVANFMRPDTGLKRVSAPAAYVYWYRTGKIEAARYYKLDVPQATDILYFACEATFCREANDPACDDPCPSVTGGRRKREAKMLKRSDFKKLVKRNSDKMVTVKIKIKTDTTANPDGNSMVIVWCLVGVGCVTMIILACCLVAFCRVRRTSYGRSNAYRNHIDASSMSSSDGKSKRLERGSEPVSVVKVQH